MNPWLKILIGLVLLGLPLALYAYDIMTPGPVVTFNILGRDIQLSPVRAFLTVLEGTVPPFLALIGLFIVWLELDELRIERELKQEEEEEEKPKKKKK
ncbi:MAG: hypothetical protein QXM68_03040 [Candidatus Aenigmatarchaeota archaeon]|nr:hypothetical protein [Candidatus Aenigmarchaeota archaeon]MCX8178262.1 hypothetical protein [Candidatus Aenigmarchaeota archaeon]